MKLPFLSRGICLLLFREDMDLKEIYIENILEDQAQIIGENDYDIEAFTTEME
jgi:hypothetical protein